MGPGTEHREVEHLHYFREWRINGTFEKLNATLFTLPYRL